MLIAYLDESERNGFYHVGAAVAEMETWERIESSLEDFKLSIVNLYGLPSGIEFHGHPLMGSVGDWQSMRGMHGEIGRIYARFLRIVCSENVAFFIQGVDVKRLNSRYSYPNHPHNVCMSYLLERVNKYVLNNSDEQGIVIADETGDEMRLKKQMEKNKVYGTGGYQSSKLAAISDPLIFISSSEQMGLQADNLMLYIWQRNFHVRQEPHPRAQKLRDKLMEIIHPNIQYERTWRP